MNIKKYEVVQQNQKCNIYEFNVPEIDNEIVISSIRNTLKNYPRLNLPPDPSQPSDYPKYFQTLTTDDGIERKIAYFNNSSGRIRNFHSLHTGFIRRNFENNLNMDKDDLSTYNHLNDTIEYKMKEICSLDNQNFDHNNTILKVHTYWCAIYEKGDMIEWHAHGERIVYTGVYYASTDDITPLVIKDESSQTDLSIVPKKGTVIVFPGLVSHMVPALPSAKERIIVGIDFNLTQK